MKAIVRSLIVLSAIPFLLGAHCATDHQSGWSPGQTGWSQGWSQAQRIAWYTTSQGSRLIPQAWLHALEQPDTAQPFLDPAFIATFRYLPSPVAGWTAPDPACPFDPSLPLGFVVDCQSDTHLRETKLRWKPGQAANEPWVGMNCSACHTTSMTYGGKTFIFDGGPTLADFQSFTDALTAALQNTLGMPDKFARFADGVLGKGASDSDKAQLAAELKKLVTWENKLAALNAAPIHYGFGRLDAIGHIFNKVALEALPQDGADTSTQTPNPSDAPVSYPFLWNVTQLNKVEWNGIADNKPIGGGPGHDFDYGALGRNTGEVIGVFADITIAPNPGFGGYVSSIDEPMLVGMEEELQTLQPPKWPAEFGALNADLVQEGSDLFGNKGEGKDKTKGQGCVNCHARPTQIFNVADKYKTNLTPLNSIQTDIWMACNAVFDGAQSGAFTGTKLEIVAGNPIVGPTAKNLDIVHTAVVGALLGKAPDLIATAFEGVFGINRGLPLPNRPGFLQIAPKQLRKNTCMRAIANSADPNFPALVYKARPLQGIWATAPYLHNGSVASLYELLLPAQDRMQSFFTGSRLFDPQKVGYETGKSPDNSVEFSTHDKDGNPIEGNSNTGHDYGNADLSPQERGALIEYMKSL